jgi:hypothetical protein
MKEFSTYIYKENETATHNKNVMRDRPHYIGIIIFLIGVVFYILDFDYVGYFIVIGFLVFMIGQITTSGRLSSVGYRPLTLKLTGDSIFLGADRIELKNKNDIEIQIVSYKGQAKFQTGTIYQEYHGNDNVMRIRHGDKTVELKFILNSERHKDDLVDFCEVHGIKLR